MLSIRLRRAGSTKKPHYRVVVADSRAWRDGRFVEILGHYDPRKSPAVVKIDAERAKYWISKGAQPVRDREEPAQEAARGDPGRVLRTLLATLAKGLASEPSKVRVHQHEEDGVVHLEIEVSPRRPRAA